MLKLRGTSGQKSQYYYLPGLNNLNYISVGSEITAEEAIAVDTPGTFTIRLALSDGKGEKEKIRRANFVSEVP